LWLEGKLGPAFSLRAVIWAWLSQKVAAEKSSQHHQSRNEIASDNPGGLKGSMQHWLAVYPPEFQIPMFFVAVD